MSRGIAPPRVQSRVRRVEVPVLSEVPAVVLLKEADEGILVPFVKAYWTG